MAAASLRLVLGDQLSRANPALAGLDPATDRVALIEAPGEATPVRSHKARIALFLSAMRHFAEALRADGVPLDHVRLDDDPERPGLAARLERLIDVHRPAELVLCEPGDWRVLADLQDLCARRGLPMRVLPDTHFLCSTEDFARWAGRGKSLRMETFYRWMRKRHGVLMGDDGEPEGGRWNFDEANRGAYPRSGPGQIPAPARFEPDAITREVFELVERRFADHPGSLASFGWPVTRDQALVALARFIDARLVNFGRYQDAMWTATPFGWHALIASSLNLKLLDPREVVAAAERAWSERAPAAREGEAGVSALAAVEGFVRQVLGWREFVRGVYWLDMPGMADANHYGHDRALPAWWWTGDTQMACLRDAIGQTMREGYAHHIQRLMLTGNFALLAGLAPREVAAWYLAVYVDAVEWVELPNVAGMALYANGGRFTTKPYVASGAYVKRMSNYCGGCAYSPEVRTGPRACPMTTLYWRFLDAHESELAGNPRTALMAKNLARLSAEERAAIRDWGDGLLADIDRI
jgi:deoxyribodipyrimidine photolyase-related protein